jgi:hypothetical protein
MGRRDRNNKPPRGTEARAKGGWGNYPDIVDGEGGTGGPIPTKEHVNKYSTLAMEYKKKENSSFRWGVLLLATKLMHLGFAGAFLYHGYILHEHLTSSASMDVILSAVATLLAIGLQLYAISIASSIIAYVYKRKVRVIDGLANLVKFERMIKGG